MDKQIDGYSQPAVESFSEADVFGDMPAVSSLTVVGSGSQG